MKKVILIFVMLAVGFGVAKLQAEDDTLTLNDKQIAAFSCFFGYIEAEAALKQINNEETNIVDLTNSTIVYCSNKKNRQDFYMGIEYVVSLLVEMDLMTDKELEENVNMGKRIIELNIHQRAAYACYIGVSTLGLITKGLTDESSVEELQDNMFEVLGLCKKNKNREVYYGFIEEESLNNIINLIMY